MSAYRELPLIGKYAEGKTVKVDPDVWEWARFFPWHLNDRGYPMAFRSAAGYSGRLHRIVMGDPKGCEVHHINGDTLDARRVNLLVMERSAHLWTRPSYANRAGATSRYKGVSLIKKNKCETWRAGIRISGRNVDIGRFATEEEAARAYDAYARQHVGPHAFLNFPEELAATG